MFIAVYEFEITEGTDVRFRQAWLEVTKAIYQHCGSLGSRLHTSDKPNRLEAYAQRPSREQWQKAHQVTDASYLKARRDMRECVIQSRTVYQLDVIDDCLQSALATEH